MKRNVSKMSIKIKHKKNGSSFSGGFCVACLLLSTVVVPSVVHGAECDINDVTWPQGERNRSCSGAWHYEMQKLCEYQDEECEGGCIEPEICSEWTDWARIDSVYPSNQQYLCHGFDYTDARAYCDELTYAQRTVLQSLPLDELIVDVEFDVDYVIRGVADISSGVFIRCTECCEWVNECTIRARYKVVQSEVDCGCAEYSKCMRPCEGASSLVENRQSSELGVSRSDLDAEIRQDVNYEIVPETAWCTSGEDMPANNQDEVRAKFERVLNSYLDLELQNDYDADKWVEAHVVQMKLISEHYMEDLTETQQMWADFLYYRYPEYDPTCGK